MFSISLTKNTIPEFIKKCITEFPTNPVFSYYSDDRSELIKVAPNEFKANVDAVVTSIISKGYKKAHIGILSENSYAYLLTFFSICSSDNVAVLFDANSKLDMISNLLEFNDCDVLFYSKSYVNEIEELKKNSDVEFIEIESVLDLKDIDYDLLNKVEIHEDDDAIIAFTSGTSGNKKGVLLKQKSLPMVAIGCGNLIGIDGVSMHILPFYHMFSLDFVLGTMSIGSTVFISKSLRYLVKDILSINPEILACVPAVLANIYPVLEKLEKKERLIVCGGAPGSDKWIKPLYDLNANLHNGYGLTECGACIALDDRPALEDKDQSMKVLDVCEVKIDNKDENGIGEIIVKGETIMERYYKMQEETSNVMIDGYFHTGDLGYLDEDNRLTVVGRIKNIIVLSNGENIAPEPLENEIMTFEGVKECIVTLADDVLQANIYAPDANQELIKEKIKEMNNRFAFANRITNVVFKEEEFAKNSTGKIIRINA